jgi:hypothetical protein
MRESTGAHVDSSAAQAVALHWVELELEGSPLARHGWISKYIPG